MKVAQPLIPAYCFQASSSSNNNNNNNTVLNNQQQQNDSSHQQSFTLKTIVNNLHEAGVGKCDEEQDDLKNVACNKCKEQILSSQQQHNNSSLHHSATTCKTLSRTNSTTSSTMADSKNAKNRKKDGRTFVGRTNLAFIDAAVEEASWYQPRLSRHLAVKILADCPVGSFVVRQSQTHSGEGCLALTVRVPRALAASAFSPVLHYLVLVTEEGFRIKGFAKVFPSLAGLVVHHSVMKESLPCRLLIENDGGGSGGESDRESDFADLDSDPEYPGLIVRLREQFSQ